MINENQIIELILKSSKILQDILNNHLLSKFSELHNIKPEYNKFSAKQEVIAKRAYFMSVKKRYALWIINSEGVAVDETNVKGLVTRRSDYPVITKILIKELMEMILRPEKISFKSIKKFIKEKEKLIKNLCISGSKEVSKPASFTRELKDYKKIPYQVHGMILWNELEYEYFIPGTNGNLYRIKDIDPFSAPKHVLDKLNKRKDKTQINWIAIPYEEETIPNYYIIDTEHMIKYAWTDRIQEFLEPLWKDLFLVSNKNSKREVIRW